jgi:uncharacterized protein YbaP (TraB family)
VKSILAAALLAALAIARPAFAAGDAAPVYAQMPAHPALWTIHGSKGTVYLFGSVHLLPPQVDWHTKEIDAAIARSDILVFEIALDGDAQERMQAYIAAHGMLPAGQHLHDMLSPDSRKELDTEVAKLPVSPEAVDRMRPWLAALTIEIMGITKEHYSAASGVDQELQANANGKPVVGLETVEQQLSLLAPDDPKVELQAFEAGLKTSTEDTNDKIGPLLDAWMHGRVDRIASLTDKELAKFPEARKLLFDDRNHAWAEKIASYLEQPKIYFITVGAAHLAGPHGVPALLRARGFHVDGP